MTLTGLRFLLTEFGWATCVQRCIDKELQRFIFFGES